MLSAEYKADRIGEKMQFITVILSRKKIINNRGPQQLVYLDSRIYGRQT